MFLARGCCYLISTESIPINDPTYAAIAQARIPVGFGSSLTIGALIALAVVLARHAHRALHRVRPHRVRHRRRRVLGAAHGPVGRPRTKIGVYLLSGFCAALGGIVMTFYMLSGYSLHAVGLELDAIAAVVIGGTLLAGGVGYVAGTLFGVLILGIIQTLIAFDGTLSSWWTRIVVGALLLLFCLLQRLFEGRTPQERREGGMTRIRPPARRQRSRGLHAGQRRRPAGGNPHAGRHAAQPDAAGEGQAHSAGAVAARPAGLPQGHFLSGPARRAATAIASPAPRSSSTARNTSSPPTTARTRCTAATSASANTCGRCWAAAAAATAT